MPDTDKPTPLYTSETSKHRELVARYCTGVGVDVGFGGDPVTPAALRMDLAQPYAYTGDFPVQLPGDCRDLKWFRDGVLDYVYSSHVLEDFDERETEPLMREWLRVIKVGGRLVLLLPDQQLYLAYCKSVGEYNESTGVYGNPHHSIAHFSLDYVKAVAGRIGNSNVAAEHPKVGDYSFVLVLEKTTAGSFTDESTDLRCRLHAALQERDELKLSNRDLQRKLDRMAWLNLLRRAAGRVKRTFIPPPKR